MVKVISLMRIDNVEHTKKRMMQMSTTTAFADFDLLSFDNLDLEVLEVGVIRDAVQMPETGASSGSSSCSSQSTCGSTSTCCI
jgi:thiazolylpeptide-type bacteriocin precursor